MSGADAVGLDIFESRSRGVYFIQYRIRFSGEVLTLKIYIYKNETTAIGKLQGG